MVAGISILDQLRHFVRLGRPLFLVGGVVFHGLGVAMALQAGADLNVTVLFWGQVAVTAIQLMTNYSNEFFDFEADVVNQTPTSWSGGSRVLPDGLLAPRVALVAALTLAAVTLLAALVLAFALEAGPLTLPLLLLALITAWIYSAPPARLHSRGVGELATSLLVPGLTPLIGFHLQMGRLAWSPVLAVLPLCCLQFAMLLSVHLPDAEGDEAVGKRTLVVRMGRPHAARLYLVALTLAYLLLLPLVWAGLPGTVAVAILLTLPVALWQMRRVARGAWAMPTQWNSLAFWSVALLIATAVLEAVAYLWLVWQS